MKKQPHFKPFRANSYKEVIKGFDHPGKTLTDEDFTHINQQSPPQRMMLTRLKHASLSLSQIDRIIEENLPLTLFGLAENKKHHLTETQKQRLWENASNAVMESYLKTYKKTIGSQEVEAVLKRLAPNSPFHDKSFLPDLVQSLLSTKPILSNEQVNQLVELWEPCIRLMVKEYINQITLENRIKLIQEIDQFEINGFLNNIEWQPQKEEQEEVFKKTYQSIRTLMLHEKSHQLDLSSETQSAFTSIRLVEEILRKKQTPVQPSHLNKLTEKLWDLYVKINKTESSQMDRTSKGAFLFLIASTGYEITDKYNKQQFQQKKKQIAMKSNETLKKENALKATWMASSLIGKAQEGVKKAIENLKKTESKKLLKEVEWLIKENEHNNDPSKESRNQLFNDFRLDLEKKILLKTMTSKKINTQNTKVFHHAL